MGGGVPSPNNGRSEYLVDTESNTIIYPKTRIEDIIGLENFNPSTGIDVDSYFELSTKSFTRISGYTRWLFENVSISPGIWAIHAHLNQSYGNNSPNNAAVMIVSVSGSPIISSCWMANFGIHTHFSCDLLARVTEDQAVTLLCNSAISFANFTCTLNGVKLASL